MYSGSMSGALQWLRGYRSSLGICMEWDLLTGDSLQKGAQVDGITSDDVIK